jgi:hypothetical protein
MEVKFKQYEMNKEFVEKNFNKKCNCCGYLDEKKLKKCSRSQKVFYCTVECQKKDWNEHKLVCKTNN